MEPIEETKTKIKQDCKWNWKLIMYLSGGIMVTALWIVLFVSGLIVNSSYYRAAINYNFAGLWDWFMTIISFTLSNVPLLALLAGILGGICSFVGVTENCTLSNEELQRRIKEDLKRKEAKQDLLYNISPVLYESPFLSGFRGVMVFVGILTLQYVSSFADLGSIDRGTETAKVKPEEPKDAMKGIPDSTRVTAKEDFVEQIAQTELELMKIKDTDSLVNYIFYYKSLIDGLPANGKTNEVKRQQYEATIKQIRNKLNIPSIAQIPGMTAASYFKFATIVSFLAFLFGYDPRRFTDFISKFNK
jgi:hypothetical protein